MDDRPWIRSYLIDGEERTDTTFRTPIIEYYIDIPGKTFVDLGAADGYESRAVALRGAKSVLAVEGKAELVQHAFAARDYLKLKNLEVLKADVRNIDQLGLEPFDAVLCFGFLYHMDNPFNMLKRIRNVTGGLLLLETHVAPYMLGGLKEKHVHALNRNFQILELDGIPFTGKIVYHKGEHARSKGSLDASWTFWLTIESLFKALLRAGFIIKDYHFDADDETPEVVKKYGGLLGFGHANTKVFIVAAPADNLHRDIEVSRIEKVRDISYSEDGIPNLIKRAKRKIRSLI